MKTSSKEFYVECLRVMLRPIIKFCMPRSVKVYDVIEAVKAVFVELAEEQLKKSNDRVSISRLSVITGIDRRDVKRIYQNQSPPKKPVCLISNVVSRWQHDRRFSSKSGRAKVLSAEGTGSDFFALVSTVSKVLDPYTVLYELERIGAITRTKKGVRLETSVFVTRGDVRKAVEMMASDVEDLMLAIEENMQLSDEELPHYHLVTEYDNIVHSAVPSVKEWILDHGAIFHKQFSHFLSRFDKDLNPDLAEEAAGVRVVYGGFSLVTETSQVANGS